MTARLGPAVGLVVAKAPVAGLVKTRLGRDVGFEPAAHLAAAALLDTLDACEAAFGVEHCQVALTGDLSAAVRGAEISARLVSWTVHEQRGDGLGERLANAHLDVGAASDGPVVQVGMDTPHASPAELAAAGAAARHAEESRAVLGHAPDGGWWVLAVNDPELARCLEHVPMSTEQTGVETELALVAAGATVSRAGDLSDVDTVADAVEVAAAAPHTRFAETWRALPPEVREGTHHVDH